MKNLYLRMLATDVNDEVNVENGLRIAITLSVNGQLISGQLVSRKHFHGESQNAVLKKYYDFFEKTELENTGENKVPNIEELNFLHLINASYWVGNTKIPSGEGINITVNIDSVDAYHMGSLSIG